MLQLRNKSSSKGPLWLVESQYAMGSDPGCNIKVTGPGVQGLHAELKVDGDNVTLENKIADDSLLTVNGKPVMGSVVLNPGDVVKLGTEAFDVLDPKMAAKAEAPAKKAPAAGWAFKALNTALEDKSFPLAGQQTIGRSQECDICLGVVHLSRKHARVTVTDSGLKVEDLNSSNGTYVNGKKVASALAIAGDEVSFDTLRFRVIGPVIDQDKTALRPSTDGDMTTIRPALDLSGMGAQAKPAAKPARPKPAANVKRSTPAKAAPKRPQVAKQPAPEPEPESSGSNATVFALVAVVVIAGAAAAWFLMK